MPFRAMKNSRTILAAFIVFLFIPTFGATQERTLLVGSERAYPPFCFINEEGEIDGFSIDLIKNVLEKVDKKYRFRIDSWQNVKGYLEKGTIDLLPLVGRTPERESQYDFTFPYYELNGTYVTRSDREIDLDGADKSSYTIAVMKGDNADEYATSRWIDNAFVRTETFEEALILLSEEKVDAVVIQRLLAHQLINKLQLKDLSVSSENLEGFTQSFCIAVKKGDKDLLSLLNEGLSITLSDGTFDNLQYQWFSPMGSYNRNENTIVIGGDSDYPPYEFLDENGRPAGFNVDLSRAIADYLDLNIVIELAPWSETYNKLINGEIDMVQGLFYSTERDRSMAYSQAHSRIRHVVLTRSGEHSIESFEELMDKKILLLKDDITHEYMKSRGFSENLIPVESFSNILVRLSTGEADCALAAQGPAIFWKEKLKITNLEFSDYSLISPEYNYGALDENSDYLLPFKEGLALLKANGEYREIESRWLGLTESERPMSLVAKLMISFGIAAAIIILLIVSKRILQLRKEVRSRDIETRQSEALFKTILNSMNYMVWVIDLKGEIVNSNRIFKDFYNVGNEDFFAFFERDSYGSILFSKEKASHDHQHTSKSGNNLWWHTDINYVDDHKGNPILIGISTDITHRKKIETQLSDSEEKFKKAIEEAPVPIMIQNDDGEILHINRKWTELSGYTLKQIPTRKDWVEKAYGRNKDFLTEYLQALSDLQSPFFNQGEFKIICLNGESRIWDFHSVSIGLDSSSNNLHMTVAIDISEKKTRDQELVKLEQAIEQSPVSIIITDYDGNISFANKKACETSGYDKAKLLESNARIFKSGVTDNHVYQEMWETIKDRRSWSGRIRNRNRKGELYWEDAVISPVFGKSGEISGFIATKQDVTEMIAGEEERKALEQQLHQKSKMDVIGQMAGGIAHDYNNIFNGVMNAAHLLKNALGEKDSKTDSYMDIIFKASERAVGLSDRLLSFSRKNEMIFEKIDIHYLINETVDLLANVLDKKTSITTSLDSNHSKITGNASEIHNCLMNICINAGQAMAEGGSIEIRTFDRHLESDGFINSFKVSRGTYCAIEIRDEGSGIEENNLSKIFEPFFTTKEPGEGTGLGLAAVYGTVLHHGGFIEVESRPDDGTAFYLFFQASEELKYDETPHEEKEINIGKAEAVTEETILVVDDEKMNRIVLPDLLETLGFKTIAAADGFEALEIFRRSRSDIGLIILDFMMPQMNGRETFTRLREIDPEVPIIIASGFAYNEDIEYMKKNGLSGLLNKPYKLSDIERILKTMDAGPYGKA